VAALEAEHFGGGIAYVWEARWASTAVDPDTGGLGDPATVSYSFVPDNADGNEIFATFDAMFGSRALWQGLVRQCFDAWSEVSGLTFTEVGDDGAPWYPYPDTPGGAGLRGDIRIGAIEIDGPYGGILAFADLPPGGDVMIDKDEFWADTAGNYRLFRNTLTHELGHSLGLLHVMPADESKLMEPYLSLLIDGPQDDDIRGINRLYGDDFELNDARGLASALGSYSGDRTFSGFSLDARLDEDWYALSGVGGRLLGIAARPIGSSYFVGPQFGEPALINTMKMLPLRLELYDSTGAQPLAAVEAPSVGLAAEIGALGLPPSATQLYFRVLARTDADAGDVQCYELEVASVTGPLQTVHVRSSPHDGVPIRANPQDVHAKQLAATPADFEFAGGQVVTLSAPAAHGGLALIFWSVNGVPQSTGEVDLTMEMYAERSATVCYGELLAVSLPATTSLVVGENVRLTTSVTGGRAPFRFSWSPTTGLSDPTSSAPLASPKQNTTYTVTVVDADGQTRSATVKVTILPQLVAEAGQARFILPNQDFVLAGAANGGLAPYGYTWSPEAPLNDPHAQRPRGRVTATTVFTLTITDDAGRKAQDSVRINVVPPVTVTLDAPPVIRPGDYVDLTAGVAGGLGPFRYDWAPLDPITAPVAGTYHIKLWATTDYRVTVTDSLGQQGTAFAKVYVADPPQITLNADPATILPGEAARLTAAVSGGAPPFTYAWSPADGLSDSETSAVYASPAASITYTVTVTDAAGQIASASVLLVIDEPPPTRRTPVGGCGFGFAGAMPLLAIGLLGLRKVRPKH